MRILSVHAKSFSFNIVKEAIEEPEEIESDLRRDFENTLVLFTTIENSDEVDIVSNAVSEVLSIVEQVRPSSILIYPYAHLSQDLAPPSKAMMILRRFHEELLKSTNIPVYKAPFGWYKSFKLECYGHPLSELSRTITRSSTTPRKHIEKKFYIITPSGEIYSPEEFNYENYPDLKILVDKEVYGKELEGGENRVNDYCRKFGFEWEPLSDHGHMRYNPLATTMIDAVYRYSWLVVRGLGIPVYRVMGTNMFSLKAKPVYEHAVLFGDRLYEVEVDNERYVLRYAACHQQFAMIKDWIISYKDLPLGVFEIADSYRLEQRGEVNLCFRLRKFYMPDLHILTRDLQEAIDIAKKVQSKIHEEASKLGRKYIPLYNVTEDFFNDHRDQLIGFIREEKTPVLVAVLPAGIYYWVVNVEYHIIDNLGRPREIATWQIDIGNGKRFNITYVDEKGEKRHPVIIHTAIIGSIERYIYMVLDTAAHMEKKGATPTIPTWLAPIQVRIIPLSREHLEYAYKVYDSLLKHGIRVDIDDRDITIGKKIREAAMLWIPYIVVVGQREVETGTINVKIRVSNEQRAMRVENLIQIIEKEIEGYPRVDLAMPERLSTRPVF